MEHCRYFIDRSAISHESASGKVTPLTSRCVLHGRNDVIKPEGWCEYFRKGEPGSRGSEPKGLVTKSQSGYVNDAKESMKK